MAATKNDLPIYKFISLAIKKEVISNLRILTSVRGLLKQILSTFRAIRAMKYVAVELNHSFLVQYRKDETLGINLLCEKYGTDKGEADSRSRPYDWPAHNYADYYDFLFGFWRDRVKILVECGVGTNNPQMESTMGIRVNPGGSLRMWRDYFPNAQIFGVDIDDSVLFSEERIKTFHCDQTNPESIGSFVASADLIASSVDIIIDDGLHRFSAGTCFFENMIDYLRPGGFYIVEDVRVSDVIKYKDYFLAKERQYVTQFVQLETPFRRRGGDNRLVVVRKK